MNGMPRDLILVRHGESEGNVVLGASKKGDQSYFQIPEFRDRPGHDWRLTDEGIRQAQQAGTRIRQEFPDGFDRYYVSDFARAKETAHYLAIPDACWFINIYLHEQLWGRMDVVPRDEMEKRFPGAHAERNRHRFYGSYQGGEWMGQVCMRADRVEETLGRECGGQTVIMVCHGNVMWAFRIVNERLTPYQFHLMDSGNDPTTRIDNGQIIHYQSRNGRSFTHWRTMRSASTTQVDETWHEIIRPSFTNEELLRELDHIPRLITK